MVARNDTLERIFRRLKLDLADLASLRSLPGVREALDSLRPGEALRVTHKDGSLYGLERRLNETQTLRVSRDASRWASRPTCCRTRWRPAPAPCTG